MALNSLSDSGINRYCAMRKLLIDLAVTHQSSVGDEHMAKPAFIYAFDNLGPYRFTELCGEILGSRYNGFLLGGEGADGGIDGEIDKYPWYMAPRVTIVTS